MSVEIRDKVIGNIRLCWNPKCNHGHSTGATACTICFWTEKGPPFRAEDKDAPKVQARARKEPRNRGMNDTEARYAVHLDEEKRAGRITRYHFEDFKVRLADGCWWNIDFVVIDCDGFVEYHDVKALWQPSKKMKEIASAAGKKAVAKVHIEDDAMAKMKGIAERYPEFKVLATWLEDGIWRQRVF